MKECMIYSDYFRMTQEEVALCDKILNEHDETEREKLISQLNEIRGIYKNENGELCVNELKFVKYLFRVFYIFSINGHIAFYNYASHKNEYVSELDYLSIFKTILDEVDCKLWSPKLEGKYKSRFKREVHPRLREWAVPENWITFENGCFNTEEGTFYPGDYPGIHSFSNTGYCYDAEAKAPEFTRFINDILGGDSSLVAVCKRQVLSSNFRQLFSATFWQIKSSTFA